WKVMISPVQPTKRGYPPTHPELTPGSPEDKHLPGSRTRVRQGSSAAMLFHCKFLYALIACVAVPAAASAQITLPTGGTLKQVDFERHVMGLLSKAGCNSGSCHGSFQGKNGFRLSLFGYEPAMDFAGLTRDNLGRRVNIVKPDES